MTCISAVNAQLLNPWDGLPNSVKTERTIIHDRGHWNVGDYVTLWYVDYNEFWSVDNALCKDIDVNIIKTTSRVEDFNDPAKYARYMDRPRVPILKNEIMQAGYIKKPIFCVRHLTDSDVEHGLLDGKFTDLRVVDGHHRLLLARECGIKKIPCVIYELGKRNMTRDQIIREVIRMNYGHNPWNHSIHLGDGIVTPGGYRPTVEQKWQLLKCGNFKDKNVLDLGCCEGGLSIKMIKAGATHVTGVDIEPERIDRANFCLKILNLENRIDIVHSDIDDYLRGASPNQFDVVVALSVIHHNEEKEEFFNRALNILRPGGELILESRGPDHNKEEVRSNGRISVGLAKRWYSEARTGGYRFSIENITLPRDSGGDFKWWTVAKKVTI